MRRSDLADLKALVAKVVQESSLGAHLKEVLLEFDNTSEGGDFFRVLVQLDTLNGVRDEDMEALTSSIENSVIDIDERFPSVRFTETA